MIQQMAIWSLVSLHFLNPGWTSGSSLFTYCWILAWRILSITLLVFCEDAEFSQHPHTMSPQDLLSWEQWPPLGQCSRLSWAHNICTQIDWGSVSREMLRAVWSPVFTEVNWFKKKQNFNFNRERIQKNRPVKYDERWGLKVIVSESQNTAETAILKSQLKT